LVLGLSAAMLLLADALARVEHAKVLQVNNVQSVVRAGVPWRAES